MSIFNVFFMLLMLFFFKTFFFSLYLLLMNKVYFIEFNLFNLNSLNIEFLLMFDWMSSLFTAFVLLISSMVILYSKSYMSNDLNSSRFILLVVMFVFSMMLMILSPNLISILLGWDGLGLVSYCLVIYYQNVKSYNAGMLTALSNRVGDVMLLMAIAWMMNFGSWNFTLYLEYFILDSKLNIVGLLVLIAAFTKSAQIPFSSWLPAAMAAPTPVSALVHSSTLVTAGVYLMIRFHFLIMNFNLILLFVGLITMFMAGLGANFEFDLKKIIALSTLSQLGLMFTILGLGAQNLAFFHLLTHALFKALLFMCAGNFIHLMGNCQDIRFMGSLINKIPMTVVYFNVSNLSLCGIPFFSGFYSKDLIMEFYSMSTLNLFVYMVMFLSLGFTVSYSVRLVYYLMYTNIHHFSLNSIVEHLDYMFYSMGFMFLIVVFSGSGLMWVLFDNPYLIMLPLFMKIFTLLMVMIGGLVGFEISRLTLIYSLFSYNNYSLMNFFSSMWNMPYIFTFGMNYSFIKIGKINSKFLDQGWSEFLGSRGLFNYLKHSSILLQYLFKNNLKFYLMMFLGWIIILMIFNF
uniref:NADH dehydrogenase subunit 5 n=1 Tax=Illeis koebelei TaxID=420091 RepID=UPI0021823D1D|nr:NADH dehydrogenase subunit 5 [Illeis koebelei]UHJ19223.1 NADH dehydrogenase subunit 5 [Illeis koebelei]UVF63304.1 NADH dehydrogenase subunit 5 [Illeis koebelei]